MRILLIHNYYQYRGGEETYFGALTKLLKENGHKVMIYTKNSNDINGFLDKVKIAIGMFWNIGVEKELSDIIKDFKPDIAQFQNIFPMITPTAYNTCKKFRIPIVQRVSNYRFMCPKATLFRNGKNCEECVHKRFFYPSMIYGCYQESRLASLIFSLSFFFHRYVLKSYDFIDKFIFPTEFIKDYYVKNIGLDEKKFIVIPTFSSMNTAILPKASKRKYFLYVGRLSEEKGIIMLLDLFKRLQNHRLVVIGDGPLKEQVEKYKIYPNITIKGFLTQEKIYNYMSKTLAVIIPSLWHDVLPNVLLESISCKTTVILPKFGSFENIIKADATGQIYSYSSEDELIKHITTIKKKIKYRIVKRTATKYNPFNPDSHYDQLIKAYNYVRTE